MASDASLDSTRKVPLLEKNGEDRKPAVVSRCPEPKMTVISDPKQLEAQQQQYASTKDRLTKEVRVLKHPTSFIETLVHLLKGNIGSGMFAMGDAFKNAGLALGTGLTLVLGVVCIYNNHVLVNCSMKIKEKLKLEHCPNFPDTVEMCFELGPPGVKKFTGLVRRTVKIFIVITQLGFCCVYFVFVSSTMETVLKSYNIEYDVRIYMLIMFIPVLISCLIRSLKFLAPISLISNFFVCASVFLTLYLVSKNLKMENFEKVDYVVKDWTRLPLFLGTVIYAFEGIGLILPLQNEMKNPDQFGKPLGVLNIGLSIVTSLLIIVGFVGYLTYGEDVKGSLSLNLPNDTFSDSVQIVLSIGIVFSYALQFYVAAELLWKDIAYFHGPFKYPVLMEQLLRTVLVIITLLLAAVIPKLGLFISLIGAVSSTALALIYPAFCDIFLYSAPSKEPLRPHHTARLVMDGITLAVAVVVFFTGTYFSLEAIVVAFQNDMSR